MVVFLLLLQWGTWTINFVLFFFSGLPALINIDNFGGSSKLVCIITHNHLTPYSYLHWYKVCTMLFFKLCNSSLQVLLFLSIELFFLDEDLDLCGWLFSSLLSLPPGSEFFSLTLCPLGEDASCNPSHQYSSLLLSLPKTCWWISYHIKHL